MKNTSLLKKIGTLAFVLSTVIVSAQTVTLDFEEFSLPTQSYYKDTTGADFTSKNLSFDYNWHKTYKYWSAGFSYTNVTDSTTSGLANMYATKAYKGYNNSNYYLAAKSGATIRANHMSTSVFGSMKICNSTYAYNSMRDGDAFGKKFGGVSGNDTDWFKLTIYGYKKTGGKDSVEVYLADFRSSDNSKDYIVKDWITTPTLSGMGDLDSVEFNLSSSDTSGIWMNTPDFFCIDNIGFDVVVGIDETNSTNNNYTISPNPVNNSLNIYVANGFDKNTTISIYDLSGKMISNEIIDNTSNKVSINTNELATGMYVIKIANEEKVSTIKFIKE